MTDLQIREHEAMKKKFPNYPKLPKFILTRKMNGYKKPNEGLRYSCVMGFYSRVTNWHKANTQEV